MYSITLPNSFLRALCFPARTVCSFIAPYPPTQWKKIPSQSLKQTRVRKKTRSAFAAPVGKRTLIPPVGGGRRRKPVPDGDPPYCLSVFQSLKDNVKRSSATLTGKEGKKSRFFNWQGAWS